MNDLWKQISDLVAQLEQSAPGGETLESVRQARLLLSGFVAIAKKGEDWGDPSPLVTVKEAARMLGGVSRNSIHRWLRARYILSVRIGRRRFITRESIQGLLESPLRPMLDSSKAYRGRRNWRTVRVTRQEKSPQTSA